MHDLEQGTPEWHQLRAGKYTGSNAHKLLKYGAIDYAVASQTAFTGNFYTKRGHLLEDQAITVYEKISKVEVSRLGFVTNDKYPTCGYSPDGMDYELGYLLEVKCFNQKRHLEIAAGNVPMEIMAQIQFGMMITGIKRARLLLFNPEFMRGDDAQPKLAFHMIEIKRNPAIEANFKSKLNSKVRI